MTERKRIASISVITDDDCGMYYIGELDGGFEPGVLQDHIERHGSEGLLKKLALMTHNVVEAERQVRQRKQSDGADVEGANRWRMRL